MKISDGYHKKYSLPQAHPPVTRPVEGHACSCLSRSDGEDNIGSSAGSDGFEGLLQIEEAMKKEDEKRRICDLVSKKISQSSIMIGVGCIATSFVSHSKKLRIMSATMGSMLLIGSRLWRVIVRQAAKDFDRVRNAAKASVWKDKTFPQITRFPVFPIAITWNHCLRAMELRANYVCQYFKFGFYKIGLTMFKKETTPRDVLSFALNTAVMTMLKVKEVDGRLELSFDERDFHSPFFEDGRKTSAQGKFIVPKGDFSLKKARVEKLIYDGKEISKPSEQLLVLSTLVSMYIHPTIHSFSNNLFERYFQLPAQDRKKWEDIFIHGQFLNQAAADRPADSVGIGRNILAHIFAENIGRDIHDHGDVVKRLLPYSQFANFLLKMRSQTHRLVKKHEVPVDPEVFFITSTLHSIDHYMVGREMMFRDLTQSALRTQHAPYLLHYQWYKPSENLFTNRLVDKRQVAPFYEELYQSAKKIDPELAEHVTVSISF